MIDGVTDKTAIAGIQGDNSGPLPPHCVSVALSSSSHVLLEVERGLNDRCNVLKERNHKSAISSLLCLSEPPYDTRAPGVITPSPNFPISFSIFADF